MKIIIAIVFLSACYFLYRWAISKYRNTDSISDRRNKAESYLEAYPLSVFQRLNTRYIKFITDEQVNIVLREKGADYAEEESKRSFIGGLTYLNCSAINELLGKSNYDYYTLTKKEVNTIYANRDSLRLEQIAAIERTFEKDILENKRRKKYYESFKTPPGLSDIERKEFYLTFIDQLDKHIDEVIHAKYTYFKHLYPNGFIAYRDKYEVDGYILSEDEYVDNEDELNELEELHEFKLWQDEQVAFTQFSESQVPEGMDYDCFDIEFSIPEYNAKCSNGNYRVCQHFGYSYSNSEPLHDTHLEKKINDRDRLEKFGDNAIALIDAVKNKYRGVYVLFGDCGASADKKIESEYLKLQQLLDDKQIPYHDLKNGLPRTLKEHYIVVVELSSSNAHLIETCKSIIDSFRRIPCITYISYLKEHVGDVMIKSRHQAVRNYFKIGHDKIGS